MMKNLKNPALKAIKKAALKVATYEANAMCNFMYGQPKLPSKIKKLRKF
ncbi:cyclic lactone autoinducer peptide [Enterococcus durans]